MKKQAMRGQGETAGGGQPQAEGAPAGDEADEEHPVVPSEDPADASKTPKGKKDEV